MKKKIRNLFNWKNALIALVSAILGTVLFLILFYIYYTEESLFYNSMNCCFIVGAFTIFIDLLFICVNFGVFDTLHVGMANLLCTLRKEVHKKYDGVFSYSESKRESRKTAMWSAIPIGFIGLCWIVASFIFALSGGYM